MYCLTEEQIEYILNDIRRCGVELEDLQLNLLDHICCILEQELEEKDDFERSYRQTLQRFYRKELKEIEEETIHLLTFKNYYGMKRTMMISGAFSAIVFIFGSLFKAMYWPGAGIMLVSGITVFSLVFLPTVFALKAREGGAAQDRVLLALSTVAGIMYCLSAMFLVQHWPGARIMWLGTLGLSAFVLVPLYFFRGIRRPETKLNTIVTTIILLGVLGIQFTLTNVRSSPSKDAKVLAYVQSEQLLQQIAQPAQGHDKLAGEILEICRQMKQMILDDIGLKAIPPDFLDRNIYIAEIGPEHSVFNMPEGQALLAGLKAKVDAYNAAHPPAGRIPVEHTILDAEFARQNFFSNLFALNNITQLQLFVANAENKLLAAK